MRWKNKILSFVNDKSKCWICDSGNLTREHKYKRTDLKEISFDQQTLKEDQLGLLKFRTNSNPIPLQSIKSRFVKFDASLCEDCNNSTTQPFDKAYEKVIKYFKENLNQIKIENQIDLSQISDEWLELKTNFIKYCVKHVGCRIFDANFQPSNNMREYLTGSANLDDLKFIFQLKNYYIDEKIKRQIYLGPLTPFEQNHKFIGYKTTSLTGWYSFNELSINYLLKIGEFKSDDNGINNQYIYLDKIDYSALDNMRFDQILDNPTYPNLLEYLEYYPFVDEDKEVSHYNYIKQFENNR